MYVPLNKGNMAHLRCKHQQLNILMGPTYEAAKYSMEALFDILACYWIATSNFLASKDVGQN